jgi:hypothetical protein
MMRRRHWLFACLLMLLLVAGNSLRSRTSLSLRLRSPRDRRLRSFMDVLLDAWDTKPDNRIRRTFPRPPPMR